MGRARSLPLLQVMHGLDGLCLAAPRAFGTAGRWISEDCMVKAFAGHRLGQGLSVCFSNLPAPNPALDHTLCTFTSATPREDEKPAALQCSHTGSVRSIHRDRNDLSVTRHAVKRVEPEATVPQTKRDAHRNTKSFGRSWLKPAVSDRPSSSIAASRRSGWDAVLVSKMGRPRRPGPSENEAGKQV